MRTERDSCKKINLKELIIKKAKENLAAGDFYGARTAEAYLKSIEEKNKDINAYLEVFDDVLVQADRADRKIKEGGAGALLGIPLP